MKKINVSFLIVILLEAVSAVAAYLKEQVMRNLHRSSDRLRPRLRLLLILVCSFASRAASAGQFPVLSLSRRNLSLREAGRGASPCH